MKGQVVPEIQSAWIDYVNNPDPQIATFKALDLRSLAENLQVLPVYLDMGGCLGLQLDGAVVSFLWDDERYQLRNESEERIRNMAYYQGSRKFSELAALVPSRPPLAKTCSHCGGTGKVSFGSGQLGFLIQKTHSA